ncbi:MAG: hypothetical protein HY702_05695 [Gemmatimonadetes bacterium]|nr:hypothetical protein [Gemmatimonadota bacterium]
MPRPSRARSSQGNSAPAPDPLEAALDELALRDPRPTYRGLLKKLKARNAAAYEAAVAYHEEKLKRQAVAAAGELVEEWIEYGRYIAELCAPGRTVLIDPTGLAEPYRRPIPPQRLVLHLPEGGAEPGVILLAPESPTPPQRAACDLLAR